MTTTLLSETRSFFQSIHQRVQVTFNYKIHFTTGLFNLDNPLLANVMASDRESIPKKAVLVLDSGLVYHYSHLLDSIKAYASHYKRSFYFLNEPLIVPGGEEAKNKPELLEKIQSVINEAKLCRHSYLLAIGGGAVLDLAGYAAATAHRGVRLIRIPTTVLAQNDSGVGVKNSINAFGKKNFLGTFAPPYAVLNDFDFLTTLDNRDWRSGIAEAVKVALIKDGNFFDFIAHNTSALAQRDRRTMQQLIYRCAQLHLDHIASSGDPFEMGSSRPLDFGHWAAHRLEYLTHYDLRHGEAVAIGIALDSTYSYLIGYLDQWEWKTILTTLTSLGFKLFAEEMKNYSALFAGIAEFQEHLGGELTLMLLKSIGQGVEVHEVNLELYQQAVSRLQEF
jgi:3-dehydroquinate synthase